MPERRTTQESMSRLISFTDEIPFDKAFSYQQIADGAGVKLDTATKYFEIIRPLFEGHNIEFIPKGNTYLLVKRRDGTHLLAEILDYLKKLEKIMEKKR